MYRSVISDAINLCCVLSTRLEDTGTLLILVLWCVEAAVINWNVQFVPKKDNLLGKKNKSLYQETPHVYNQSDKVSKVWSINFVSDSYPFYSTVWVCWFSLISWFFSLFFQNVVQAPLCYTEKKTTQIKSKLFPVANRSVEQWIESHSLGTFHHFVTIMTCNFFFNQEKKNVQMNMKMGVAIRVTL